MATNNFNTKRKFVADGVMFAEINELLSRELTDTGYSGVEIRNAPMRTEIIVRSSKPQDVLGEKGRRIRELTSIIQQRFNFPKGAVELYAERVANRGLSAQAQADSLKFKLLGGLSVRRACYGIMKFVMESGAKGVEVVVAGKLRGQRAKAMKFRDGYMVKTGQSAFVYQDYATRHVMMRQGIMGVRVKIMLPHDPTGQNGVKTRLSDVVDILTPKEAACSSSSRSEAVVEAPSPTPTDHVRTVVEPSVLTGEALLQLALSIAKKTLGEAAFNDDDMRRQLVTDLLDVASMSRFWDRDGTVRVMYRVRDIVSERLARDLLKRDVIITSDGHPSEFEPEQLRRKLRDSGATPAEFAVQTIMRLLPVECSVERWYMMPDGTFLTQPHVRIHVPAHVAAEATQLVHSVSCVYECPGACSVITNNRTALMLRGAGCVLKYEQDEFIVSAENFTNLSSDVATGTVYPAPRPTVPGVDVSVPSYAYSTDIGLKRARFGPGELTVGAFILDAAETLFALSAGHKLGPRVKAASVVRIREASVMRISEVPDKDGLPLTFIKRMWPFIVDDHTDADATFLDYRSNVCVADVSVFRVEPATLPHVRVAALPSFRPRGQRPEDRPLLAKPSEFCVPVTFDGLNGHGRQLTICGHVTHIRARQKLGHFKLGCFEQLYLASARDESNAPNHGDSGGPVYGLEAKPVLHAFITDVNDKVCVHAGERPVWIPPKYYGLTPANYALTQARELLRGQSVREPLEYVNVEFDETNVRVGGAASASSSASASRR